MTCLGFSNSCILSNRLLLTSCQDKHGCSVICGAGSEQRPLCGKHGGDWKLLGGEWVVGGHSEPEVERNTNLTDMHKCSYVSNMPNCSYVSDMQHCCLFQQSATRARFKMNCDYGVGLLLGGHVFILFCIVFLAYSYTNFPRVSCSVSFSCWSKTVHVFTGSELHWLIWIQPSLTGLFSTGVYCLESDYNDSLLRKMVFHSI